jgi:hypothetical protein
MPRLAGSLPRATRGVAAAAYLCQEGPPCCHVPVIHGNVIPEKEIEALVNGAAWTCVVTPASHASKDAAIEGWSRCRQYFCL